VSPRHRPCRCPWQSAAPASVEAARWVTAGAAAPPQPRDDPDVRTYVRDLKQSSVRRLTALGFGWEDIRGARASHGGWVVGDGPGCGSLGRPSGGYVASQRHEPIEREKQKPGELADSCIFVAPSQSRTLVPKPKMLGYVRWRPWRPRPRPRPRAGHDFQFADAAGPPV